MSTGHTKGNRHPERSEESQEWVELGREFRHVNSGLYDALGGNDDEDEIDPDKYGYGENTSSK
jgi:hypothetical protein